MLMMKNYVHTSIDGYLNEGRSILLKRKYGENSPVTVSPNAPLRNQVLSYVAESRKVSKTDLKKFIAGANENSKNPVAAANMWVKRNQKYFITENRNGKTYYKLSNLGKKLVERLNLKQAENVNENKSSKRRLNEGQQMMSVDALMTWYTGSADWTDESHITNAIKVNGKPAEDLGGQGVLDLLAINSQEDVMVTWEWIDNMYEISFELSGMNIEIQSANEPLLDHKASKFSKRRRLNEQKYDFVDKTKGYERPGIYDEEDMDLDEDEDLDEEEDELYEKSTSRKIREYIRKKKRMAEAGDWDRMEDEDLEEGCDEELDESKRERVKSLIENLKAKSTKKLNEEEEEEEEDVEEDELSFDDIDLEGDEETEGKEGEENEDEDEDGETDDEEEKVEITEFIISVDDAEEAIEELKELGVDAEKVEDKEEGGDEDEEENEEDGEQIKVSADDWETLKGWLEEKGVDIEEMFGGEIELEDEEGAEELESEEFEEEVEGEDEVPEEDEDVDLDLDDIDDEELEESSEGPRGEIEESVVDDVLDLVKKYDEKFMSFVKGITSPKFQEWAKKMGYTYAKKGHIEEELYKIAKEAGFDIKNEKTHPFFKKMMEIRNKLTVGPMQSAKVHVGGGR